MKNVYTIIIFILFACHQKSTYGQVNNIAFEHISVENGLSQSSVYAICKDSKGFMWFGTAEGLNRYDGYKFISYKANLSDSNSISDSWITCIFEDSYKNLWIGTHDGGLNLFNYAKEQFSHYKNDSQNHNSLTNNTINAICEGENGLLWIATNYGINSLDLKKIINTSPEKQSFSSYKKSEISNLPNNEIISLCFTADKELWLGTYGGGFSQMNLNKDGSVVFVNYQSNVTCSNNIWSICQDKVNSKFLWILNSNDLEKFDRVTKEFIHSNKNPETSKLFVDLRILIPDQKGNLWMGTKENGLLKFDTKTGKLDHYKQSNFNITSLSKNNILSIYQDNEGLIWVGTKGGGINKKRNDKFVHYENKINNPKTLNGKSVWAVYKDRSGIIWAGTEQGLNKLNRTKDEFTAYTHQDKNPQSISDNSVYSIFEDKDGDFWIGTSNGGLNLMDRKTGIFKHYKNEPENANSLSFDYVRSIVQDDEGNLWIGTRGGGLNKFDKKKEKFKEFKNIPNNTNSLSRDRINALLIDKNGILWIATSGGGINRFDTKTETFKWYKNEPLNPNSLNDSDAMSLCEDKEGNIWVGTYEGGLNLFDKTKETFKHYTEQDGLSNNVIYGILEDGTGKLWLSTNKGISKFDPKEKKFENFDISDGLQHNEFNTGACYKSSDGEMFFGGINGFNVFNPEKIYKNPIIPPTVITELKIINKKIEIGSESALNQSITTTKEITLSYLDYIFSFEFSALSFISSGKNKYKFMLEGFDKDWINADPENRIATYTNLEGGSYTFRIKAANNDGVWNETGTALIIHITPPFWKTWWFKWSLALFFVFCLIGFYFWRVNSLRSQKKQLEKTVEEKTKEVVFQKEELQSMNEELIVSNEELYNQREELESTLNSLQSAQKQLIQAEKMASLGTLAAGVAHEINNPLNFIQGGVFFLENYFTERNNEHLDEIAPILKGMQVGVNRAAAIVASLNHYSRQDDLPFMQSNIHAIIDNCLIMLQNETKNRIEILKNYTSIPCCLYGNEGKLHQAMLNILANAVQAISDKGTITITTEVDGQKLCISIADDGCGISLEAMPKIFDPFYTTKEPGKGTGLGLAITYNIINEHNGKIEFDSTPKIGTQVKITFPLNNKI